MASIPTRTVRVKATGSIANINVRDFDPKLHEDPNREAVRLAAVRDAAQSTPRQTRKRSAAATEG